MIGCVCGITLGVILSFLACWRVALAVMGAVPVIFGSMAFLMTLMYSDATDGGGGAYTESGAIASEAVLNIRTVRACRAEKQILSRFSEKLQIILQKKSGESVKSGA